MYVCMCVCVCARVESVVCRFPNCWLVDWLSVTRIRVRRKSYIGGSISRIVQPGPHITDYLSAVCRQTEKGQKIAHSRSSCNVLLYMVNIVYLAVRPCEGSPCINTSCPSCDAPLECTKNIHCSRCTSCSISARKDAADHECMWMDIHARGGRPAQPSTVSR
ncbi:hypothetical protein LZ31DRAFT_255078 [Colletotrichum somersetense]|nr:hypothetical protein LZ31DRAFT_255078 [Colletotrichum somersetense]